MNEEDKIRLDNLLRHIKLVQDGALVLGKRLIDSGEEVLGLRLIANAHIHDYSKFSGIEWLHLNGISANKEELKFAVHQHQQNNPHHPEYWGGIENMPDLYLCEAVVDWQARASEFGTSLRDWIKTEAMKRYNISPQGKVYKRIKFFVDMLLNPEFKKV